MKSLLAVALILELLADSCQLSVAPPAVSSRTPPVPTADPLFTSWEDRSIFRSGLIRVDQPVVEQLASASVYHLQFEIDRDLIHLRGAEEVHYTNNEDVALKNVEFRLFPNILGGEMHISDVLVDGRSVTPEYGLSDSLLIVPLPLPLEPGRSADLHMDFTVRVPETVESNYGVLASAGGVLTLAHAYPMIPVYNEEGWNAEIPPQSGDLTFADMSFYIVRVTAPKDLTLVAVGDELAHTETAQTQVVTYAAGPVRDFYLAASPDYTVISNHIGETRINFYAATSLQDGAKEGLDAALRAVKDYSSRYVPYPYAELDLVVTPTLALGIEYPGMIAIADRIVAPANTFLEATVAHEVGHQWFYNLVGNDQLDDPWLDESLAQFLTLEYFGDEYGEQGSAAFKQSLEVRWQRVEGRDIPIGMPVADYTGQEYGAIVYGRGALFFEALRQEMGSSVFDAFLRDYAQTYSWDIATPEDLKSLAEEHCTCDLTPMFEQWVYP